MISLLRPGWPDEARLVAQLPTLKRLVQTIPFGGRCLNAGCGEGLYCGFLESFKEITAIMNIDLLGTPAKLAHLKDPRHSALDGSLTALPFPDETFDCCLCTEVMEHIPDDVAAARELGRCLRPGGRLLLSVPHPPAPFDPNHVREGYTLDEMSSLLGRHGFKVIDSGRCFSGWLGFLLRVWRWQHKVIGRTRRNLMPRLAVRAFGYADRVIPLGHKWDLVVAAVKT